MSSAVVSSTELCRALREFGGVIEKGFDKERDVATERDAAVRGIGSVVSSAQAELAAVSVLSTSKDKFAAVLKTFQSKVDAEPE